MTVSTETSKIIYNGLTGQTVFAYNFRVEEKSHMEVYLAGVIVAESTWTIDGLGNPAGGNVTLNTPLGADQTVTLLRNVPQTQQVDYQPFDAFPAETHEAALDKLTMLVQEMQEQVDRVNLPPPDRLPPTGDDADVGGNLTVGGTITSAGAVISDEPTPIAANHLTRKDYVDTANATQDARLDGLEGVTGPTIQVITTSDPAWVPPAGAKAFKTSLVGAGGGGGGADGQGSGTSACATGGAGGGLAVKMVGSPFEASYAIVIGAAGAGGTSLNPGGDGGASTFIGGAVNMSAGGGNGGNGMLGTNLNSRNDGAFSNPVTGGDLNVIGNDSMGTNVVGGEVACTGLGAAGPFGGAGRAREDDQGTAGSVGGGGGGGTSVNNTTNRNGGPGGDGVCIIEVYY